ncbi:MAG: hypothetical protein ACLUFT_10740 [Gemmiger formicilis]|uniref:hypothetical protein n=1 Tax=Gemmiger formicilis TaxID=745368 RepID=UPI0039963D43
MQYTNIGGLGGKEEVTEKVEVQVGKTVPLEGIPIGTTVTVTEDQGESVYQEHHRERRTVGRRRQSLRHYW